MNRLKLIGKGAMVGGVCTGLEEYTNVDVTIWRGIFLLGTLLTTYPLILIYATLWVILPEK